MSLHDLVFSDRRSVRLSRHLLFWTIWFIYIMVTYVIPTNWVPGWDFKGSLEHIKVYGFPLAFLRIVITAALNTLLNMALVYGILYYFFPRYISQRGTSKSKNKSWIGISSLLFLFVCVVAFLNYFTFVLAFYLDTRVGYFKTMPGMNFIIPRWSRPILFNYPTIVGIAL